MSGRVATFGYGVVCYAIFFCTYLYSIGFIGNLWVPKTIDSGAPGPAGTAILVNLLLLLAFGSQHSVMARPGFKRVWTRLVPEPAERSTYVLFSSIALIVLFRYWQPMPEVVWEFTGVGHALLTGLFLMGFLLVLYATFLIDHFDLFGLRQVYLHLRGIAYTHRPFKTPSLYRVVRHPLYVGWFMAFWCTPRMTQGHLLFAAVGAAYILVAILFEERDLLRFLGEDYRRYRERVPMLLPFPRKKKTSTPAIAVS